ncbi:hypothetical protein OY671_012915, partial [Metschnikowia pulcherrima]
MPGPSIKICGITTPQALSATIKARAEYVGFNFYPPSPRFSAFAQAPASAEQAQGRIKRVGVFVDA